MSGMTCSRCGRGPLEGFKWTFEDGRLTHAQEEDYPERASEAESEAWFEAHPSCVEVHGVVEGMVECELSYHVVWPNEAVLAEQVLKAVDDRFVPSLMPRRGGFEPNVIRFKVQPSENIEVPETCKAVIFEAHPDGTPYLACSECAEGRTGNWAGAWPSGVALRPYKRQQGPRSAAKPTRVAPAPPPPDPSVERRARYADVLSEPLTTEEIAARLGVTTRTVRRDLEELKAVSSRVGKSIRWSIKR